MKLYFFPVAPNPTKVRLFLAEKAFAGAPVPLEEVVVNLAEGEQSSPEHLARSPLGRLPTLELDDGSHVIESMSIIEYLEERFPEAPMIGSTPEERARVRDLERIADGGVLGSIARIVHATNSPLGKAANPAVAEVFRDQLQGPLAYLETRLSDGRPFVAGERPSVADCTLQAAFQFGRFGGVPIDPHFEQIARWDAAYRSRPPAQQVLLA